MLHVVATPIGNLNDFSPRGIRALREAEIIACEDTRRTRKLLTHFEIPKPRFMVSYRQGNEDGSGRKLLSWLREGRKVVLCSDSGYPGISDPGYRLIHSVVEEGLELDIVPGPSAPPMALLFSGFSTASYTFKGYPPRKTGKARRFFEMDRDLPHTLILFESPYRVAKTLSLACDVLGNRQAAVCFELTKTFQHVWRGTLDELAERATTESLKGEITLVITGRLKHDSVDEM